MSTQIQRRRGTTAQHASFTGAIGETTIDTDKEVVVVHDGTQVGGYPLMRENGSNSALALGSAATPSLKFTGDTNTGIYSPGADQVAISTNSSQRLVIDASGNVGIGISPAYTFHVSSSSTSSAAFRNPGAANTNILVGNTAGDTSFRTLSTGDGIIFSDTGKYLAFGTNGGSERLRITSAGLVGVGSSSPVASLQIGSAGSTGASAATNQLFGDYSTSAQLRLMMNNTSNYFGIGTNGGSSMIFGTSAANAGTSPTALMTLTSGGSLGIGNSSPGAKLDISGSGNLVRLGDGTNTFDVRFQGPNNWATELNTSTDTFNIKRNSSTLVTVDSSGRLGIGVTGPGSLLHLGHSTVADIRLTVGSTLVGNIYGSASDLNVHAVANVPLTFATNNTERARIDSSGRLLVGTSTAGGTELIQVQGTSGGSNFPGGIALRRSSLANGDDIGYVNFTNASGNIHAGIKAFTDGTPGASDYPGALTFSTTADGAASPTERMRIQNTGRTSIYSTTNAFDSATSAAAGTTISVFDGAYGASGVTGGTTSCRIWSNGNVVNTNNSYGAISDIKLKQNIVDASSQWDDLKALQVRKYNLKEGQTHTQIGLVAQEAELVSPGLVYETSDRDADGNDLGTVTKSVNYSVLYMKAVKALQEAMERIEALEADVAQLKGA
jgi:hypothetical protein